MKKAFWRSKAFWASVIAAGIGVYETVIVPNFNAPAIPPIVYTILAAVGLYGRAVATQPLGMGDDDVQNPS